MPTQDIVLAVAALIIAVVGVRLPHPPKRVQTLLIGLASVTALLTIAKAFSDYYDKQFFENALTSTLRPSNAEYGHIGDDISVEENTASKLDKNECSHDDNGIVCFLWASNDKSEAETVVLDRSEVAKIYAAELRKHKTDKFVHDACVEKVFPEKFDESFKAKTAMLADAIYFDISKGTSQSYYDDNFGINTDIKIDDKTKTVTLPTDELKKIEPGESCHVYFEVEQIIRREFAPFKTIAGTR